MTAATAPLPIAPAAGRTPVAPLAHAAAGALLLSAAGLAWLMVGVFGALVPPVALFVVLGAGFAVAILRGGRRTPALAVLYGLAFAALNGSHAAAELAQPTGTTFAPVLLAAAGAAVALLAGAGALAVGPRRPGWLAPALAALAGAWVGAAALSAAAHAASADVPGVSPRALAALPAVVTRDHAFVGGEIRVRAGERVALRLDNADGVAHSFDVDELDVHVPMPGRATALALFTAGRPGRYVVYCAPHYDRATGQGMKTTLVVEP
jgi:plastocyanin